MGRVLQFTEHFFWTMVWVVLVLVMAGFLLHFMSSRGIAPGIVSWIGGHADLAAQAGGGA